MPDEAAWHNRSVSVEPYQPPEWRVRVPTPWPAAAPYERPLRLLEDLTTAVVTAVFVALSGAIAGLIWAAIAPKLAVGRAIAGAEVAFKAQVGADVSFLAVTVVAGVLCAAVATIGFRASGPGLVTGLAAGGLTAAFIADRVGYLVERSATLTAIHAAGVAHPSGLGVSLLDFRVRALGVVTGWPIAAVVVAALVEAMRTRRR